MESEPVILQGGQNANMTYEIVAATGVYADDILNRLKINKIPQARELDWMRKMAGGDRMIPKRKAKQQIVSHYEEAEYFPASATIAVKATPTANEVDVTLSAGDHFDSGTNSYPKVTQLAMFNDQTVGYVSAVDKAVDDAHVITIERLNTNQDVQTAAVVGDDVIFYTNAQTGGSTKIGSHIPNFERIDNHLHTFREDIELEDHEMQNDTWWEYKGKMRVYIKALDEVMEKFSIQELEGLLVTPQAHAALKAANGKTVRTNNSLIPQIQDGGINTQYFGKPTLTTLESAELLLDKHYGDTEMLFAMGINADQGMRHWLLDFTKESSRNISFTGQDKQTVGIDFKSAKIGSRTFHFDTWRILSHKTSLGATGFPFRNMIIGIPLGGGNAYMANTDGGYDAQWRRYFRLAYSVAPGPKKQLVDDVYIWPTGGLANTPTSDELVQGFHMVSYKTLELFCINKFMLITKG